ncbi:hypothetical protein BV97_04463 [Novosphingobium resinovorum]|uniref:Transmembrane protein n=1 Tax=Novosphingobium resinovorum TaxID=158500 RepID=A0A031JR77_9SPHN|nr:hypothetical protein [Novosphingobium resinovorum]EZP77138.1 hypothetical protein BV97_04463 [Novosphingobium resinovorum]
MAQLTRMEITNWLAIYVGVGLCCALAVSLSVAVLLGQLVQERAWRQIHGVRGAALFLPRTWWRWQKLYLLSTPVTLCIVAWFAATLRWS